MLRIDQSAAMIEPGKVILLAPFLHQQRGNAITAMRLFQGLSRRGFEIEIISLEEKKALDQVRSMLISGNVKLIHGLNALHMSAVLAELDEYKDWQLLLTMTGTDVNYGFKDMKHRARMLTTMERAARIVVFNSRFVEIIKQEWPAGRDQLRVIPQGIRLEMAAPITRQQIGISDQDIVFVLPSGLRRVKNLEMAIEGLDMAREQFPDIRLLIVGSVLEQDYAEHLLSLIRDMPWVSYLGEIKHQLMSAVYSISDIVINSSLSEGQPQAALEAMSIGKPALLSAVFGNLGMIEHGQQGYYFHNSRELSRLVVSLSGDNRLRKSLGEAALRHIKEHFSPEAELDAYEVLYRELLIQ